MQPFLRTSQSASFCSHLITANSHFYTCNNALLILLLIPLPMVNHPWKYHLDTPLHSSYMILQTCAFNRKIFFNRRHFFLLILYFLRIPLHELAFYSLNYPLCLFPHNSTMCLYISTKLMLLFTLCILYYLKNLQAKIIT